MHKFFPNRVLPIISCLIFLAACAPFISPFTEEAYKNATTLKARSLALIAKSGQSYSSHRVEVENLLVDVDAAYEYANGLPNNDVVSAQWDTLRNPDGNLLGGFAKRWRNSGTLSPFIREQIEMQVGEAFDTIICVEINKREASVCEK
ncbi:hypothetical protein [Ruegeria sp. HKCCD6119]|uniref:hypothetical protein n=1 Tax=Ruegeria sp. HKCCD6119 TaxID=2683003 RepID=UPI0014923E17|nr:hypothetical protein [Ruegeria sp. HKCCD6119]NOD84028.1 hypothetical protein [Ruegeria sp. HKCCD6119]